VFLVYGNPEGEIALIIFADRGFAELLFGRSDQLLNEEVTWVEWFVWHGKVCSLRVGLNQSV
jgi:hypothetical protein